MLFPSNLNPGIKSTQDLIVLRHAEERVLVPLPQTYEDAQSCAKDVFGFVGDVYFEITDLQGAAGAPVRIHSTAWEGVRPILQAVTVKLEDAPVALPRGSVPPISAARRLSALSSQQRATPGPSVIRLNGAPAAKPPASAAGRQALSPKKGPAQPAISHVNDAAVAASRAGSTSGTASKTSPQPSTSKAVQPEPKSTVIERLATPPRALKQKAKAFEEEEEEEEIRILSPTKKRVNRPRVLSDYGLDGSDDDEAAEDHGRSARAGTGTVHETEEEEEEYDELEDTEFASTVRSPGVKAAPLSVKGGRTGLKPSSSSRNGGLVQLDAMPESDMEVHRSKVREPSPPRVKVKVEKVQQPKPEPATVRTPASQSQTAAALETAQGAQSQSQSQERPDGSFIVMIEYNDDAESRQLFKTRGRHTVSKVLMQACRTFGIEEFYQSARMVLLVEDEEEGDVYRSVCNRNDTMAQAGAEPNARFVVEIVDGENDDCPPK
ncbi:hypothetical protein C8Q79DRAFT_1011162 [Trametes meyenii]|nr:hypothetical protein C8Q79DRAFT_1011162 [Trametes meyenii]